MQYCDNSTSSQIGDEISIAAGLFTIERISLERSIAAAGAVNPAALKVALADAELATGDIDDDAARFLVAATLFRPHLDAPALGRLADAGLKYNRLAHGVCSELAGAFCRDCPLIGQPCVIAAQILPRKCAELAQLIDREATARHSFDSLMRALEAA